MILINLTCGRNPWKKAAIEDSTFREFLKDPGFLRTILPLSPELDSILRLVFECDPQRRISVQRLRDLIVACPRLTTSSNITPPPTPPPQTFEYVDPCECANLALPPSPPATPPPPTFSPQMSTWSLAEPTSKQGSSYSYSSDDSGYESDLGYPPEVPCVAPNPFNFYGGLIPFNDVAEKPFFQQTHFLPSMVATF